MPEFIKFLVINGHVYVREIGHSGNRLDCIEATTYRGIPAYGMDDSLYVLQRALDPKDYIGKPEVFNYA